MGGGVATTRTSDGREASEWVTVRPLEGERTRGRRRALDVVRVRGWRMAHHSHRVASFPARGRLRLLGLLGRISAHVIAATRSRHRVFTSSASAACESPSNPPATYVTCTTRTPRRQPN